VIQRPPAAAWHQNADQDTLCGFSILLPLFVSGLFAASYSAKMCKIDDTYRLLPGLARALLVQAKSRTQKTKIPQKSKSVDYQKEDGRQTTLLFLSICLQISASPLR
jgi:hypothetical protein